MKRNKQKKYKLTYARTVIFEREFEADDEETAHEVALEMEHDGELGFESSVGEIIGRAALVVTPFSQIKDIVDEENIWEIEEAE